jgi:hypothetical protein
MSYAKFTQKSPAARAQQKLPLDRLPMFSGDDELVPPES